MSTNKRTVESYPTWYEKVHDACLEYPEREFDVVINHEGGVLSEKTSIYNWISALSKGTEEQQKQATSYRKIKKTPLAVVWCSSCRDETEHTYKPGKPSQWVCLGCRTPLMTQEELKVRGVSVKYIMRFHARDGSPDVINIEKQIEAQLEEAQQEKLEALKLAEWESAGN